MDLQLREKVILVTGGSKGLGLACAKLIALEGATVIIASRNEKHLRSAAASIMKESGGTVSWFKCDVSKESEISSLASDIMKSNGGIDGMVINAGGPPPGGAISISEEDWRQALSQNLLSAVRLCKAFVPSMKERGGGRIVAITSVSAKQPIENLVLSNTTRLGVIGYLKTLAGEVGRDGILINSVLPGPTLTGRLEGLLEDQARRQDRTVAAVKEERQQVIPVGRFGKPRELAALVTFLISSRNSYITGQAIAVDGGYVQFPL